MSDGQLVTLVVALHYLVTFFPSLSSFLILKWEWYIWVHVPIILWAFSIPFLQYPCPLTTLEKNLRKSAGMTVYEGHFIQEYIYGPLDPYGHVIWDNVSWLCPAIAYTLYFRRRGKKTRASAA